MEMVEDELVLSAIVNCHDVAGERPRSLGPSFIVGDDVVCQDFLDQVCQNRQHL